MADETYGFSADGVKRIVETVRSVESTLRNPSGTLRSKGGIVEGSPIRRFKLVDPMSPGSTATAYMLGKNGAQLDSTEVGEDGTLSWVWPAGVVVKAYWDSAEDKWLAFDGPCPNTSNYNNGSGGSGGGDPPPTTCADGFYVYYWNGVHWVKIDGYCPPGCHAEPPPDEPPGTPPGLSIFVPCSEGGPTDPGGPA